MDKNYYYEKMHNEREQEISNMWARARDNHHEPLSRKQVQRLILRIAFAVIVLSSLIVFLL